MEIDFIDCTQDFRLTCISIWKLLHASALGDKVVPVGSSCSERVVGVDSVPCWGWPRQASSSSLRCVLWEVSFLENPVSVNQGTCICIRVGVSSQPGGQVSGKTGEGCILAHSLRTSNAFHHCDSKHPSTSLTGCVRGPWVSSSHGCPGLGGWCWPLRVIPLGGLQEVAAQLCLLPPSSRAWGQLLATE